MNQRSKRAPAGPVLGLGILLVVSSCGSPDGQPAADCEPAAPVKVERISLGRAGAGDNRGGDWCRACVWAKAGFASCQRVFAESADEGRDAVRARARAKACQDAGWPVDACPDDRVISLICKGDASPAGTENPGAALQDLYRQLNPEKFPTEPTTGPGTAPDAGPPPPAAPATE
jgi:hypothetical protein